MPDTAAIVEHLMFHKALLGNEMDIDYYINLAQELESGVHIVAKDPLDKVITIIFELVVEEKINPWNINLENFVKIYMDKIRDVKDVDFIMAGKIILMAWKILAAKSEQVLEKIEIDEEDNVEYEEPVFYEPEDFGYEVSELVYEDKVPLIEPVRREESAPVSLFDLISAMHEVRREIEKKRRRRKVREKFKFNLEEKVHKEDLEAEIREVWERLSEVQGDEVAFTLIYNGTREDFITVFIALLFLEKFGKVELEQYAPYSEIYIKIKVPQELRKVEFMSVPEISIAQI